AAVGQVVAIDRGHDDEPKAHLAGRRGDARGLERVDGKRAPVGDVAEPASPRADVAQQQERRRPTRETFSAVRAPRLLADRREGAGTHDALDRVQVRQPHPFLADPFRGARRESVHCPGGTIHGLAFSCRARISFARPASSREAYGPTLKRYCVAPLTPRIVSTAAWYPRAERAVRRNLASRSDEVARTWTHQPRAIGAGMAAFFPGGAGLVS